MRIGVYIDVSNLYLCLGNKYGRKLDFVKFKSFIEEIGDITICRAYGAHRKNKANQFIKYLNLNGIDTYMIEPKLTETNNVKHYKANCDVKITIDVLNEKDEFDLLVLASADGDFAPLVLELQKHSKDTIIIATEISKRLQEVANKCIEIPPSILMIQ